MYDLLNFAGEGDFIVQRNLALELVRVTEVRSFLLVHAAHGHHANRLQRHLG